MRMEAPMKLMVITIIITLLGLPALASEKPGRQRGGGTPGLV